MDISWSGRLSWYLCWNPFCIFNQCLPVQFDPFWGFTVSLFSSASLLLCNLTALERNLKLQSVNIITHTHPYCYSEVALVHVNVFQCQIPHRDANKVHASFVCIGSLSYRRIKLCSTQSTTVSQVHLSEIQLTRKFAAISCWKILICNYTKNEFRTSAAWADVCTASHPVRHGY